MSMLFLLELHKVLKCGHESDPQYYQSYFFFFKFDFFLIFGSS